MSDERLATFGVNPLTAMHVARKQLFILLTADEKTLQARAKQRNGRACTWSALTKLRLFLNTAATYKSMGIPTLVVDTRHKTPKETCQIVEAAIKTVLGEDKA